MLSYWRNSFTRRRQVVALLMILAGCGIGLTSVVTFFVHEFASPVGHGPPRSAVVGHTPTPNPAVTVGPPTQAVARQPAGWQKPPVNWCGIIAASPSLPLVIPGQSLTVIGDSMMVAASSQIERAFPYLYLNARVGRQFSTGLQLLAYLKAQQMLRPIVMLGLGTNGVVTPAEVRQLYAIVGPDRRLLLINTFEPRPWEQETNSVLAAAARTHGNTLLANWYDTIRHHTSLLWPDGIHVQPAGIAVYVRMLRAAVACAMTMHHSTA